MTDSRLSLDEHPYLPCRTVTGYKLFRTSAKHPGLLFPLYVHADTPVPLGEWVAAQAGPPGKHPGKVRSRLGELAFRPGWHASDLPVARHIGGKSAPGLAAPDHRPADQVWAAVELADDVDWQAVADARAVIGKAGTPVARTAHITDRVPLGGCYRYKTNPTMLGCWLIGGHLRVLRVLPDEEVAAINTAAGVSDLPRLGRN